MSIGSPESPGAIALFRDGWKFSAGCLGLTALIALAIRQRPRPVGERPAEGSVAPVLRRPAPRVEGSGIRQVGVFRDLAPATVERLAEVGVSRILPAGEVLFEDGDPGTSVFVLTSGRLDVIKDGAFVREFGQGELVGELAVLAGAPRSATVRAARDSVVLEIAGSDLQRILTEEPQAALSIARLLAAQVRSMPVPTGRRAALSTIAVIAAAGPAPSAQAASLAGRIERHRRVAVIGEPIGAEELVRWESDFDRVLLVAGAEGPWSDFCLRHADLVVLVVDAARPAPVPRIRECEVLLLGDVDDHGVLAVLQASGARRVHQHARGGSDALAARLAGRSIGIALAGGGARAFAHVGLLRELESAGIVVDRIAGTSVGSYIGALYAGNWGTEEIEALLREEFVHRNPLGDYGLPRYALSRGGRIIRASSRVFGDRLAETLPRELTVMATDLLSREAVPLRRGLLRDITRASAAVPGLLPPVRFGGRILVDGAVTGNLPVQPLVSEHVGPVIAVDLAVATGNAADPGATEPGMPSLGETMMRTALFASFEEDRRAVESADLVVTAQTRHIGLLEFHQIDEAIAVGRAAGRAAVASLAERGL